MSTETTLRAPTPTETGGIVGGQDGELSIGDAGSAGIIGGGEGGVHLLNGFCCVS